jgi:hypothetical protein
MHIVLAVFDADLQLADMIEVMLGERAVQQVQAQTPLRSVVSRGSACRP